MIKTIVFDLGGVYFEAGTGIALKKIYRLVSVPKETVDEIFEGYPKKEGFLYRKGKLTKEQFWNAAIDKLKIDEKIVPELQEIWHSSYKPIKGMEKLISKLKRHYKIIAFSGNIKERISYLEKKYHFMKNFDDLVLSYDVGFNKKEVEFYKALLDRIKCRPEECVFIDDRQEFLDIAKSFGMKTLLFRNISRMKSDLRKFNVYT